MEHRKYFSIETGKSAPVEVTAPTPADPSAARPIEGGRDWSKAKHPERRCAAHRKNGDQCKRAARLGTTVCDAHGARAPQVRRKAQQRLMEASDRMAKALIDIATSAESEPTRLAAVRDVLDRVGVSAKSTVEVDVAVKPYQRIIANINGVRTGSRAEYRERRGLPPLPPPDNPDADDRVIDAEVVDDDEPPALPPARPAAGRTARRRPESRDTPEPSLYGEQKPPPVTGEAAVEAAAAANRAAGVYINKRRSRSR
jgi:hypothetical protein